MLEVEEPPEESSNYRDYPLHRIRKGRVALPTQMKLSRKQWKQLAAETQRN